MDTTTNGCRKFESEPRKGEKVAGVYCVCDTELCNDGWVPDDPDTQEGWTTQGTTTTTTAASAGGGGGGVAVPGGGGGGINVPGGGGGGIAVNCSIHDCIYVKKFFLILRLVIINRLIVFQTIFSGAREKKETCRRNLIENKHLYNLKYVPYGNT